MPGAPPALPLGTVLEGRYRVDEVLARGGMSTVHRGSDLRLDRPVAIKVLDRSLAGDPAFVRRFEREARAAARLAHPGVVAVHDQGDDADGTVFLVLELVEGGTLRDVLREHGRLRPAVALTVVEQVLAALRVAHERGLVHRDVKPENVLVSWDGALKVADFGLVAAAWAADDPDSSGDLVLGTVAYLAPEQVVDGRADARSDVYAAGIVLFELLTGAPPYGGDAEDPAAEVARRHVHEDVPRPSAHAPDVPPAVDRLVRAATRRDPEDRPADAAAMLDVLRRVRRDAGLPVAPVPAPRTRPGPGSRPLRGTRLLDLEPDAALETDDLDEDDLDEDEPWDDEPEPTADPAGRRSPDAPIDHVDVAIERVERRRARTRSRRLLGAWLLLVAAATVAAGAAGWNLGLPG